MYRSQRVNAQTMFALLEMYDERDLSYQNLLVDVHILRFRNDLRYYELLKRTGLLPYAADAPLLGRSWAANRPH